MQTGKELMPKGRIAIVPIFYEAYPFFYLIDNTRFFFGQWVIKLFLFWTVVRKKGNSDKAKTREYKEEGFMCLVRK